MWAVCAFCVFFTCAYKHVCAPGCACTDVRGSPLGVIYNIRHPFCQRHRENPLVSKSPLSWNVLWLACMEEMCTVGLQKLTSHEAAVW